MSFVEATTIAFFGTAFIFLYASYILKDQKYPVVNFLLIFLAMMSIMAGFGSLSLLLEFIGVSSNVLAGTTWLMFRFALWMVILLLFVYMIFLIFNAVLTAYKSSKDVMKEDDLNEI